MPHLNQQSLAHPGRHEAITMDKLLPEKDHPKPNNIITSDHCVLLPSMMNQILTKLLAPPPTPIIMPQPPISLLPLPKLLIHPFDFPAEIIIRIQTPPKNQCILSVHDNAPLGLTFTVSDQQNTATENLASILHTQRIDSLTHPTLHPIPCPIDINPFLHLLTSSAHARTFGGFQDSIAIIPPHLTYLLTSTLSREKGQATNDILSARVSLTPLKQNVQHTSPQDTTRKAFPFSQPQPKNYIVREEAQSFTPSTDNFPFTLNTTEPKVKQTTQAHSQVFLTSSQQTQMPHTTIAALSPSPQALQPLNDQ